MTPSLGEDGENPQTGAPTEVACSVMTAGAITSTGGFAGPYYPSDLFSRPAWQEKAVQRYVAENNASTFDAFPTDSTPGYNPSGRAYPDISMYWAFFPVLNGRTYER